MSKIEVAFVDSMGSDLSVVNAARVSFGKKSEWVRDEEPYGGAKDEFDDKYHDKVLSERDVKLIKYLAKHKHLSPFGHAFASFHVKAPIFVARQLVKHKFLRWNEISRRYVDDEPEFYQPDTWRGRSADKKQGSEGEIKLGTLDSLIVSDSPDEALCAYNALLGAGVAPEQARMVLPQSLMTEFYWSGSLDAFTDMCSLRLKEDTQYETRLVAKEVYKHLCNQFPVAAPLLVEGVRQ